MTTATASASKTSLKLKPLGDRVIVERLGAKEKSQGGLYLPDTAQGKPLKSGKLVAPTVKAGDRILFGKYSGSELKVDDKEYVFLNEDDILAIIT